MRTLIRWGSFPICYLFSISLGVYAAEHESDLILTLVAISAGVALILAVLERVQPHHVSWNQSRGDVRTDIMHLVVSMGVVPEVFRIVSTAAFLMAAAAVASTVGGTIWPNDWSLWLQLPLALFIAVETAEALAAAAGALRLAWRQAPPRACTR